MSFDGTSQTSLTRGGYQYSPTGLYALIIGIDVYKHSPHIKSLSGAVADAKDVQDFLQKSALVPKERIHVLFNEQATRQGIIKTLEDIAQDNESKSGKYHIKRDEPILIFYAGHGGEAKAPPGWPAGRGKNGQIQMICPHDFDPSVYDNVSKPSQGTDLAGQGIPDRTLGVLLNNIAKAKGDNITVIFDCCHAGSGTRDFRAPPNYQERRVILPDNYVVPPSIDNAILKDDKGSRADKIADLYESAGSRSHVLLAACKADQLSYETSGRGLFTRVLFETLRQREGEITYKYLIHHLPNLSSQNPQCEGFHMDRAVFSTRTPPLGHDFRTVMRVEENNQAIYELAAGEASGVTKGSTFRLFYEDNISSHPIGNFTASSVDATTTKLVPSQTLARDEFPEAAFALQTRSGQAQPLKILIPDSLPKIRKRVEEDTKDQWETGDHRLGKGIIELVDAAPCDMEVVLSDDNTINFNISDEICSANGIKQLYNQVQFLKFASNENGDSKGSGLQYRVRYLNPTGIVDESKFDDEVSAEGAFTDNVFTIISYAADFWFHLRRAPEHHRITEAAQVRLECVELEETNDDLAENPVQEKKPVENLIKDGVLSVSPASQKLYGFKVVNTRKVPLYAALFYFDMSDLSITSYYEPNQGKGPGAGEFSIPAEGELAIGYNGGEGQPRQYWLRPGTSVDIGFVKLFLATRWVDFSNIKQESPFKGIGRPDKPYEAKSRCAFWDTVCIPVIQRDEAR